ncbi:Uncharacterised protein [Vibrio cincinnatiensis]|nr:Uncharacterised protein [Vibrio cincinnatiensis]
MFPRFIPLSEYDNATNLEQNCFLDSGLLSISRILRVTASDIVYRDAVFERA